MTEENKKVENAVQKPKGKRTPLAQQKRVGLKEKPGFTRRLVNEIPGRVEAFLEAGWVPVEELGQDISDNRIKSTNLGSTYRPVVNSRYDAPCKTAIWMEIPTELYEEDQAAKRLQNNKIEESYNPILQEKQNKDLYGAKYDIE